MPNYYKLIFICSDTQDCFDRKIMHGRISVRAIRHLEIEINRRKISINIIIK